MKISLVNLQIFYKLFLFHIYCSVLKILARCISYMCLFNFRGYQIYSYMFYIDTDLLIQTLFILKYVNVFIPLASSIQCNLNIQSTKHHWNQDVSMDTLKVFFQISLLMLISSFMYCSHVFPQIWKLISTHFIISNRMFSFFTLFFSSCTLSMCVFSFLMTQKSFLHFS